MTTSYYDLNASIGLTADTIEFEKDKEAVRKYFLEHVNQNTVFFHTLEEKLDFLFKEDYYKKEIFDNYTFKFVKSLYKRAYSKKYRFRTFVGAYKFYNSYALKTTDGKRYLERYEDRLVITALYLANGSEQQANVLLDEMIANRFQPATPTFLNAGRVKGGEPVSCFLIRCFDNMESISRTITNALQLSKRGGGVGILMTDVREAGAPIKGIENMSSGVIPVMKILEDSFSYANQLGARQGAGVVYLHANHPDILAFLDTKKENADEKIRIKTMSLGVVIPDILLQLAAKNEYMYLFSSHDVQKVYGKPFSDISVTEEYYNMVENKNIRKKKLLARELMQKIAEIQFESGYPFILFEDNATRGNPNNGKINMTNLCVEILQENSVSEFNEDGTYLAVGNDISCNLGSQNIMAIMAAKSIKQTTEAAVRALTHVARSSNINSVPSIQKGNQESLAIGIGQMNLHGYLGSHGIQYGSPESIEFVHAYFSAVRYHALRASNLLAVEEGTTYVGFEKSSYADGSFFKKYAETSYLPTSEKVKKLFSGIDLPTQDDWKALGEEIQKTGLRNKYLLAVAPTGSISYVADCTPSIAPITKQIELRREGALGRVFCPSPGMTNENRDFFKPAYDIPQEQLVDLYAAAQEHIDQGISFTVYFNDTATTRDINKIQFYAYKKGIKTLYYVRIRQKALEGTEISAAECAACTI